MSISPKIKNVQAVKPFNDDPVKMYLKAIGKERLLTAAEEVQLAKNHCYFHTLALVTFKKGSLKQI